MTTQNIIFQPPSTDSVFITVTGIKNKAKEDITLLDFSPITVAFGSDTRDSINNPTSVVVNSETELELNFQDTSETGQHNWVILATFGSEVITLTNSCKDNLEKSFVCS